MPGTPSKWTRSVTVTGRKRPSIENAFTVTSGPGTNSSYSTRPLREPRRARSVASSRPSGSRTIVIARWPWRSAALTTHGYAGGASGDHRGWGTPAASRRRRWAILSVQVTATAAVIGWGMCRSSAAAAAIRTGQSVPGAIRPSLPRAAPRTPSASSLDTGTSASSGSESHTIVCTPSARAASMACRCAGPPPSTTSVNGRVRRPAPSAPRRGRPATTRDSRCTSGSCAPSPPRTGSPTATRAAARPGRSSRCGGRPVRAGR